MVFEKEIKDVNSIRNDIEIEKVKHHIKTNPKEDLDFIMGISFIEKPHIVEAKFMRIIKHLEKIRHIKVDENNKVHLLVKNGNEK